MSNSSFKGEIEMDKVIRFIQNEIQLVKTNFEEETDSVEFAIGHLEGLYNLAVNFDLVTLKDEICSHMHELMKRSLTKAN